MNKLEVNLGFTPGELDQPIRELLDNSDNRDRIAEIEAAGYELQKAYWPSSEGMVASGLSVVSKLNTRPTSTNVDQITGPAQIEFSSGKVKLGIGLYALENYS